MDTAKVKKRSTTIIKAEMTCFKKKTFTMKERVLFFFVKFLVNNWFARAKTSVE